MSASITRLETRARIRREARGSLACLAHGVTGCELCRAAVQAWNRAGVRRIDVTNIDSSQRAIPERRVIDLDIDFDRARVYEATTLIFWLTVAAFGVTAGFYLGRFIVSAVWG